MNKLTLPRRYADLDCLILFDFFSGDFGHSVFEVVGYNSLPEGFWAVRSLTSLLESLAVSKGTPRLLLNCIYYGDTKGLDGELIRSLSVSFSSHTNSVFNTLSERLFFKPIRWLALYITFFGGTSVCRLVSVV